jgi:hypothetical protein
MYRVSLLPLRAQTIDPRLVGAILKAVQRPLVGKAAGTPVRDQDYGRIRVAKQHDVPADETQRLLLADNRC